MDEPPGQSLDPFEFHGHPASCIAGLGGDGPLPDPHYAFHTSYVPVARGHAHFHVRFTNLQARRGSLVLRVHMLPGGSDAVAQLVTSQRVQLNWLSHHGGALHLRFEAFRGARYALMGHVPDQLDASADDLSVTLDRPGGETDAAGASEIAEAGASAFGSETIKSLPASLILSLEPPLFAQPVSQPCTARQLRETAFRSRCKALGDLPADPAERWQLAYVVQALDRYGLLRAGARGLLLGEAAPVVEQALTAAGAACRRLPLRTRYAQTPSGDAIDPAALPGDLFGFDFLLSIRASDPLGEQGRNDAATSFVEKAMECLRPGGLAVHVIGHHPAPGSMPMACFDRNGLERLALSLISRGHQVARIKPPLVDHALRPGRDAAIPFGLIARRAALIR